ncbi:MAG: prolipoprotein diacylglyceryl transferase [Pseudomonadota bacterium]
MLAAFIAQYLSPLLEVAIPYPDIGPDIFTIPAFSLFGLEIGPFALRWYALAYIVGLILGWRYVIYLIGFPNPPMARRHADDFLFWATLGVILGGRLGYVLFYNFAVYIEQPAAILRLWEGGMSFHGGLAGVTLALILFCRYHKLSILRFADTIACAVPIGLFLGRLANFVNGELYGRVTDVPWAMVFPASDGEPRHPSQLYEAALEGVVLFLILWLLFRYTRTRLWPGFLTGVFTAGYGLARVLVEQVREPDAQLGILSTGLTMGQSLSLPLILLGLALMAYGWRTRPKAPRQTAA